LIGDYQTILGDTEKPLPERRQHLIRIDAEIDQTLSSLDEAVPVALLQAYAKELEAGVSISGQAQASARVNTLMTKHGGSLAAVLSTLEGKTGERPSFPAQAGVSATFAYITHFLPIAALTGCIELILPLSLWVFVYLGIVWDKHQRDPQNAVPIPAVPQTGKVKQAPRAVALTRKREQTDTPLLALENEPSISRRGTARKSRSARS
jgi:hypothetical protein